MLRKGERAGAKAKSIRHEKRHWHNWVFLDGPRDDVGEVAGDSEFAVEKRVDQALVGVDVGSDDLQDIVNATAD